MTMTITTSPSTEVEVINALSLLAHKVAPNVFDLSSLQWHVSIRDQIVRACLLMADLKKADPNIHSVLIVGMGAAGISAAIAACELGIKQVCVVDQADTPFKLFRDVTSRFVGPFMYEWPSSFHADQSYPVPPNAPWGGQGRSPLTWSVKEPITADDLAKELTTCLTTWIKKRKKAKLSLPYMLVKANPKEIESFAKQFAVTEAKRAEETSQGGSAKTPKSQFNRDSYANALLWGSMPGAKFPIKHEPDYLVLAAGMGTETLTVSDNTEVTPSFWANDTLKELSTANQTVVILGGGDGALQDALRALTTYDHPLSLVQNLQKNPSCQKALSAELPALLDADRQMRQHCAWVTGSHAQKMVDLACKQAADRLAANPDICTCILRSLRPGKGTVWLWVAGTHFDKAYLLNRLAIHLLWACFRKLRRRPTDCMNFKVRFNTKFTRAEQPSPPTTTRTPSPEKVKRLILHASSQGREIVKKADKVVVRFGIQKDTIPGLQMVQLGVPNERDLKHRATLKGIELPFVAM